MKSAKKERNLRFEDGKCYVDLTIQKKRIRQFAGYTKEQALCDKGKSKPGIFSPS